MFRAISQIVRSTVRRRRVLAGFFATLFLLLQAFSGLLVVAEADHDCHGPDCPVCQEIQGCIDNFHLTGPAPVNTDRPIRPAAVVRQTTVVCRHRAPATTLHSLDVRFDE